MMSSWLFAVVDVIKPSGCHGFQRQLSEGKAALLSCQELLEFANQSLTITNEEEFLTVSNIFTSC